MYQRIIEETFLQRKTPEQKAAFRAWLKEEMVKLGYAVREETNGSSVNVIAGDVEQAEIILCTHYDTPAKRLWPDWHFPRNPLAFILYQGVQVVWMAAISFGLMLGTALISGSSRLGLWMFVAAYLGQIALMLLGPASRKPHGSGLAFLLNELAAVPQEDRDRIAVIFWDNSCKGQLGSRAWAKAHPQQAYTSLAVNVDALSPEGDWLLMPSRLARTHPAYAETETRIRRRWGETLKCYAGLGCVRIADERSFRCGVTLTRCRKTPLIGYFTQEKG